VSEIDEEKRAFAGPRVAEPRTIRTVRTSRSCTTGSQIVWRVLAIGSMVREAITGRYVDGSHKAQRVHNLRALAVSDSRGEIVTLWRALDRRRKRGPRRVMESRASIRGSRSREKVAGDRNTIVLQFQDDNLAIKHQVGNDAKALGGRSGVHSTGLRPTCLNEHQPEGVTRHDSVRGGWVPPFLVSQSPPPPGGPMSEEEIKARN